MLLSLLMVACLPAQEPPPKKTPKEALQAFQDLIGSWRITGDPQQGSREERQKGFWTATLKWQWQFKGQDVFLRCEFDKDKYYRGAELRYLPANDRYQIALQTLGKEKPTFEGELKGKRLVLERKDDASQQTQRVTLSLLHANRYLFRYEVKPAENTVFAAVYQVGATKEGVPFAGPDGRPECIVSGGLATIPVTYKGKTYYVCCTGCRDAFNDEPKKYIREFEVKKAKKE
jgi:YHS domain-containing protein